MRFILSNSRRVLATASFAISLCFLFASLDLEQVQGDSENKRLPVSQPAYFTALATAISPPVRELRNETPTGRVSPLVVSPKVRTIGIGSKTTSESSSQHDADEAVAQFSIQRMPPPSLSFDGLSNFDNLAAFNSFFLPPDTAGDVGPRNYVQAVNSLFRVFDKAGNPQTPPFKLSQILAPLGTVCSARNDGEPTVLYDSLADRWLLSEYCNAFPPFRQMIAVSKTGDPTGQYFVYEFVMPNYKLNDFAKFGVWHNGYYMSTEEFVGSDYSGSGLFAFDRAKILTGDPSAGFIYFSVPGTSAERRGGFLPSDIDGIAPPPNDSPEIFASYSATEYGDKQDALRLFDFHADFRDPAKSTFSERSESPLDVAAFDPTSLAGRGDIGQPEPGLPIDSNSDRLMSRVAYRNFGDHESLVLNQTVRLTPTDSPYRAGVRIYRLQNSGSGFLVNEQKTLGDSSSSRWIGSAAEDGGANLAVGYNLVSDEKPPSLVYSGRLATDPAGVFRGEGELVAGTGVQKAFGSRWGDWSSLSVDPEDDCTFWMTGEYFSAESEAFSDFTWLTRIGRFKFDECVAPPRKDIIIRVESDGLDGPIENASARISRSGTAPFFRQTHESGYTDPFSLLAGQYELTVEAPGFQSVEQTLIVSGAAAETIVIHLQPEPLLAAPTISFASESCSVDHSAEPGETVTLNVSFRNLGRSSTRDLRIALLSGDGLIVSEPPRSFGIVLPGETSAVRPFTFSVLPNRICGEPLSLHFFATDGRRRMGIIHAAIQSGTERVVFSENFDESGTDLPEGWTSTGVGAGQSWTKSPARATSPPNAAFSPDVSQPGANELVSPPISIASEGAVLQFENYYDLEATFLRNRFFDGSFVEIKLGSGIWEDIESAGGEFKSGGYDGFIDACCQNPLAGHQGWSGTSGVDRPATFVISRIKLPSRAAGQTIQLRWRLGTDLGTPREGQYIDDILISDGYACECSAKKY